MKTRAAITVLLLVLGGLVAAPPAAAAEPGVTVTPSTHLRSGSVVHVVGTGLPTDTDIDVVQCDSYVNDTWGGLLSNCPAARTLRSSDSGTVASDVTLVQQTVRTEFQDTIATDCRGGGCHLFLAWADPIDPDLRDDVGSDALGFVGSPPSVAVSPSSDLANLQTVAVTGRLEGAEGRSIQVVEHACFSIVQATSCFGELPVQTGTVKSDGTFAVSYPASRFLADGSDCTKPDDFLFPRCRISVVVLDGAGNPDTSFGVPGEGKPGVDISFAGATASTSRATGLTDETTVLLTARGVTPGAELMISECDHYPLEDEPGGACGTPDGVRASASGTVSVEITLRDVVYRYRHGYVPTPVYCRDDGCRLFLVSRDAEGHQRIEAETSTLEFTGSSATLKANPTKNLASPVKWTTLWGRAPGAEGHVIKVVEQACYDAPTQKACYGQLPVRWGKVKSDGTFVVKYPAQRYLGDAAKTDCTKTGTAATCRISLLVLDDGGVHDDSFGSQALGQPGVPITFKT